MIQKMILQKSLQAITIFKKIFIVKKKKNAFKIFEEPNVKSRP